MDVIVIQSEAYNNIMAKIDAVVNLANEQAAIPEEDRYMSVDEVCSYVGFGKNWLAERQHVIGYYQDGKDRRFKRKDIDAYMEKHRIKSNRA